MRRKLLLYGILILTLTFLLGTQITFGQQVHPNIWYNASLSGACVTPSSLCATSAYYTGSLGPNNANPFPQGPAYTAIDIPVLNYNAATVTLSGTYSGATINFEFADNSNINYYTQVCARTDINLLETNEVLPTNQIRAWNCPVWSQNRFRVRVSAIGSGAINIYVTLSEAAIDPSLVVAASITNIAGASDPCADVSAIKTSAPVNISTATTTQIVALSGTTTVYVCGYQIAAGVGTNPSLQFEYGTGATCGTGTTVLTGAMATGVTVSATAPGPIFTYGPASTVFKSAAGNALCIVTAGTTPNFQGVVTYVQQ